VEGGEGNDEIRMTNDEKRHASNGKTETLKAETLK
jgi:hypothetical protein